MFSEIHLKNTHIMRLKLHFILLLFVTSISILNAQPANDTCNDAEILTLTTESQNITFDLTQAEINFEFGCDNDGFEADYADVWYRFSMPVNGGVQINSSFLNRFALYSSCTGSQIDCFPGDENIEGLNQSQIYFLRIYRFTDNVNNTNQEFSIKALEITEPDCSNTNPLTLTTDEQVVAFNLHSEPLSLEVGCEGDDPNSYADIWYEFTMPFSGSISVTSIITNRFALYDACNGNQIACFNQFNPYFIDNLTEGESYLLRAYIVEDENTSTLDKEFTIRAIEPSYPECADIVNLNVTTEELSVALDLNDASYNYELGCDENDIERYTDFWYEFTMPVNGTLRITPTIHNNVTIYDSCGGNILYCFSQLDFIDDLVQGETYTIRLFRPFDASPSLGLNFTLQAFERLTNDDCSSPEIVPTLTSGATQYILPLAGSTSNQEDTCSGTIEDEVMDAWFEVTMPGIGNLFIDTPGGNGIAIYDSCGGNELFCNSSSSSTESFKLTSALEEGNTYLVRLFETEQFVSESENQAISFRFYERAANDECSNTEVIPTITTTSQEVTFDTFGSLINLEESCSGFTPENFVDVWFEFTMPNNTYLNFESYQFNFFSIYDSCNGNEVACFAGDEVLDDLVPNQTYTLRVFQRQNLEMFHPFKFFNIFGSETLSNPETELENVKLLMSGQRTLTVNHLQTNAELNLYNMLGQRIISQKLTPSNEQTVELNVPLGIYIVHLDQGNSIETLKIIVRN